MLDVRKLLAQRPLLFDGGMGTYYKAKPGQECEQANLTDPEGILAVHRAYLAAGDYTRKYQERTPSRPIPSACRVWRRHSSRAGSSWRMQAGSWQ